MDQPSRSEPREHSCSHNYPPEMRFDVPELSENLLSQADAVRKICIFEHKSVFSAYTNAVITAINQSNPMDIMDMLQSLLTQWAEQVTNEFGTIADAMLNSRIPTMFEILAKLTGALPTYRQISYLGYGRGELPTVL